MSEDIYLKGIKNLAKKLNSVWKRIKIQSEFYVIILVNHKIDNIIKENINDSNLIKRFNNKKQLRISLFKIISFYLSSNLLFFS